MDPIAIPEWVKEAPDVIRVAEWHLPVGSGISGPPAGAFLTMTPAENALEPLPMWHVLIDVTDEDIAVLQKSHVLVFACSVVPVFQFYPWHLTVEGLEVEEKDR